MTTPTDSNSETSSGLQAFLGDTWRNLGDAWTETRVNIRNWRRRRQGDRLDYLVMTLGGSFPERDGPSRNFIQRRLPLPAPAFSMQAFNRRMQRIGDADNVHGVIFLMRNLSGGLGTLQNLRQSIERLRASGKEVVVYTPFLDMRHYYIASAADRIIAPPSAKFDAVGLFTEVTFLKDSLARVGVTVDVIQISPYKTAFDRLGQSELTPEYREQLSWLLDEQYDILTSAMAAGRGMSLDQLRALIDRSPMTVEDAQANGLIDDIAYDDELPVVLAPQSELTEVGVKGSAPDEVHEQPRARLKTWPEGYKMLMEKHRRRTKQFVGVISLEGAITMGPSRSTPIDLPIPFIGGDIAGEQTLVSLLRKAEKQKDMAALILHVDSGGGSALASDLIGRQVGLLAAKMPVLVYMGNIAASGGYYVSAPAQHIMSQPSTITGSIGVIMAHVATTGLLDMLSVNRTTLQRGDNAGLYTNTDPLSESTRSLYWQEIAHTYEQFKAVVADGRNLPLESLDPLCEGRVWTGRQAYNRQLVDSHGDFLDAIVEAARLGGLPTDDVYAISVANLFARDSSYVLPPNGSGALVNHMTELISGELLREWSDRPLTLLPFDLRLR